MSMSMFESDAGLGHERARHGEQLRDTDSASLSSSSEGHSGEAGCAATARRA